MKQLTYNHLAIGVCFILLTVLGILWYGSIFKEQWMGMVGLDMATVEANPPSAGVWISNVIATLVPLYVLAWLFIQLKVETAMRGAVIAMLISFAFHMLSTMVGDMFASRPYGLAWITGGFDLVAMGLAGLVLGGWRKYVEA